jgi:hypothetical protein
MIFYYLCLQGILCIFNCKISFSAGYLCSDPKTFRIISYIIWILIFRYPNIKKLTFNLTFHLKPALNLTRGTLNMQCHLYLTLWKWSREREGKKLKKRIYWSSSSFSPRLRLWFSSLLISGVTCSRKIYISDGHKCKMRKTAFRYSALTNLWFCFSRRIIKLSLSSFSSSFLYLIQKA